MFFFKTFYASYTISGDAGRPQAEEIFEARVPKSSREMREIAMNRSFKYKIRVSYKNGKHAISLWPFAT